MDNLVTLYHGGSVEKDVFGNVTFDGMHWVSLIFDDRPLSLSYSMIGRCLVRCLVRLVLSFNSIQMRMPSQLKGSFTLVNQARCSDS
jgi:hypothetical protein